MDVIIDALIKRRLFQEPAKRDKGKDRSKVLSILSQMSKSDVPQTINDDLADKWHELKDLLSGSKTANINRDSCRDLLRRSTLLLLELLQRLDPKKIRSSD